MASEVSICNMALFRIGHSQRIDSLSEASVPAELCKQIYPVARDLLLESWDWTFARKRVALAGVGDEPNNWEYQYQYPNDCLKARYIVLSGDRKPLASERVAYEVGYNTVNELKAIYCDLEDAELVYTAAVSNVALFTPSFCDALSWAIAKELVTPLAKDSKFVQLAGQQAELTLRTAQALDINESQEDYPDSEFVTVRD